MLQRTRFRALDSGVPNCSTEVTLPSTSQSRNDTSKFSYNNNFSKQFVTSFSSPQNTLLESHWFADSNDLAGNDSWSTLDEFIERTVNIDEFARLDGFLAGRSLDCARTPRTVAAEIRSIFSGTNTADPDMNRLFRFTQGRTVGDMLGEYQKGKSDFRNMIQRSAYRARFERAQRNGNDAEMYRIEKAYE